MCKTEAIFLIYLRSLTDWLLIYFCKELKKKSLFLKSPGHSPSLHLPDKAECQESWASGWEKDKNIWGATTRYWDKIASPVNPGFNLCFILTDPVRVTRQSTSSIWCLDYGSLDSTFTGNAHLWTQTPKLWKGIQSNPRMLRISLFQLKKQKPFELIYFVRVQKKRWEGAVGRWCMLVELHGFVRHYSAQTFSSTPSAYRIKPKPSPWGPLWGC